LLLARHPTAEKCSCIFGMSAIHGRQKKPGGLRRPDLSISNAELLGAYDAERASI
jgi:hypothetical protein